MYLDKETCEKIDILLDEVHDNISELYNVGNEEKINILSKETLRKLEKLEKMVRHGPFFLKIYVKALYLKYEIAKTNAEYNYSIVVDQDNLYDKYLNYTEEFDIGISGPLQLFYDSTIQDYLYDCTMDVEEEDEEEDDLWEEEWDEE